MKNVLKHLICLIIASLLVQMTFAGGGRDITERQAENLDSWQESFDITEKKAGKYNIVVTAEDFGGNTSSAGPYNIIIDPDSDLPIIGITNPIPEMRIPGNLNIVGTCVDDDAVGYVELIFDGKKEEPVKAEGAEFWSYYLDTTKLAEGLHTIEVYGVDINGVKGHSAFTTWHLDRRMPETTVQNYSIGDLVSGRIHLSGIVTDGNGIKTLTYSVDGGNEYELVDIKEHKDGSCSFSVPVDTTKMADGAAVCWFKATDKQGTTGLSSFLFFVDNTKPSTRFLSPKPDEVVNGIFSVAGSASDIVGLQSLTWDLNGESGEFELVAGNPYWIKEFDLRNYDKKNAVFTLTATDIAGNVRVEKLNIAVDSHLDRAVTTVQYPVVDSILDGKADSLFVRGFVTDDDGAAQVFYSVDDGSEYSVECDGVFSIDLTEAFASKMSSVDSSVLSAGRHTITLYAVDVHGIKGIPITVPFIAQGEKPVIKEGTVDSAKTSLPYQLGMEIHPESGSTFNTTVASSCGLTSVEWKINGQAAGSYTPKEAESKIAVSVPMSTDKPWGVLRLDVIATDIYQRQTTKEYLFYLTNLAKINCDQTVVFEDSSVSSEGFVSFNKQETLTGFFAGGNAKTVRFQPETDFAKVSLDGNTITIKTTGKKGTSQPVQVIVTSDRGLEYKSKELTFVNTTDSPFFKLENEDVSDGFADVKISGSVSMEYSPTVEYRIIPVAAQISPAGIMIGATLGEPGEYQKLKVKSNGSFELDLPAATFATGIHIVEFVAKNFDGTTAYATHFVSKIPPLPEPAPESKKIPKAVKPVVLWVEGNDIYYIVAYQGVIDSMVCKLNGQELAQNCFTQAGIISRESLLPGANTMELAGMAEAFTVASKYSETIDTEPKVSFVTIAGSDYASGKIVTLPQTLAKGELPPTVTVKIYSDDPIKSVDYKITGLTEISGQPELFGGSENVSGSAVIKKTDDPKVFEAEIPLQNLPVRWNKLTVTVESSKAKVTEAGVFGVIRPKDASEIIDSESIFYLSPQNGKIEAFYNLRAPISASVSSVASGSSKNLSVKTEGKSIYIEASEDAVYTDITLRVLDSEGIRYTSKPATISYSKENPVLTITSPTPNQWLRNTLVIDGTATDANGIDNIQVSLDAGLSWSKITFPHTMSLSTYADGLIPVSVRATDTLGNTKTTSLSVFKDTTSPEVSIIAPAAEDVVNGETTIIFQVKDNGKLVSAAYNSPDKKASEIPFDLASLPYISVGTSDKPMENTMNFKFTDIVGNTQTVTKWDFIIDNKSDLPRVEIHLPEENQIITTDFIISGVVFDDDGKSKIKFKIDDGNYITLPEYNSTYSINVPLASMTDNEHTVYVYAEDIHGVRGEEVSRKFRISLEEPKGAVTSPKIEETVRDKVVMKGVASDKNGIALVQVSLDNGNTYNDATGTTNWTYEFDTHIIQDGTHVVFLRIYDNYGIEGLYSSLITIDNTVPDIKLELPLDDSSTTGNVFFSGQTIDNVELVDLYITVRALDKKAAAIPPHLQRIDLVPDQIITQVIDISTLPDGFYNVELTGADAGGNIRRVSRNIRLDKTVATTKVDLMYPMNGQHMHGIFNVYGTVTSEVGIERMLLYVDDTFCAETTLSSSNAFKFELTPELVTAGKHKITVRAQTKTNAFIDSNVYEILYEPAGPWISIDNFNMLDFAANRPFLEGRAGYVLSNIDLEKRDSKESTKLEKHTISQKKLVSIELSFDNGKTFIPVGKTGKWRYRIENDYFAEGFHFIVARATMENGETAITRTIIQIDKTNPQIRLISPGEGGHFNESIEFSGLSSDNVGLKDVTFALRKGDKSSYEVPSFIQGLYIDGHFWGASLWDIGLGLTFFDDNVKLQGQFGQFTKEQRALFDKSGLGMRYGGNVIGMKLLANVAYIPFRYFWGPSWQWLSAGFAVGANFSMFTETQSGKPQILSALLMQLEFPRITLENQKAFRTFSFYTEGQLWFLPTDVQAGTTDISSLIPQISAGIRINVF